MRNHLQPMKKHDYHIINIKYVEGGTLPKGSNYHNTLFNPKTKEASFALIIGITRSCWVSKRGNYKQMSFVNTCKCNSLLHLK